MRALLDVNVLLALFDPAHIHYSRAKQWFGAHGAAGWASCPLTQNGFVRIVSNPGYARPALLTDALDILNEQICDSEHEFWPDDISITDTALFDHSRILGPGQITDVYLLGLAVRNSGRLVTFDVGIPVAAVKGATKAHVVSL